jgi:hypothetical protein
VRQKKGICNRRCIHPDGVKSPYTYIHVYNSSSDDVRQSSKVYISVEKGERERKKKNKG